MPYQSNPQTESEKRLYSGMDSFLCNLKQLPRFENRLGRLVKKLRTPRGFEQKGVDVLFAIDLVRLSAGHHIQKAIIVSGDSDFVPTVIAAKEEMVLTELVYCPKEFSRHLYDVCDDRTPLAEEFMKSVERHRQ